MSLGVALSSAVSSLLVTEKQMSVVSNNISNANTAGYTTETEQVAEQTSTGSGTGISDLGTVTDIDQFLQASLISSNTESAQATTYSDIYQQLQQAMGSVSTSTTGGDDLSSQLTNVQTDLSQLANSPDDSSLKVKVVQDLDTLATNFRQTSSQIQSLRTNADAQISTTVDDVNTQLQTINTLNMKIQTSQNEGQSTAALVDARATALQSLSSDMGISYYTNSSGAVQIYSSGGAALLVGNQVTQLTHTACGNMSDSSVYGSSPASGIDGINADGVDITKSISSGSLHALISQRDTELPNAQASLDNLAQSLTSTLNTLNNQGASATAPQVLTGNNTTTLAATSPVTVAAGTTVRVAVMDNQGNVQSYADVDLSNCQTVGDVVSALNTAFAAASPAVTAAASLNSNGQLSIASGSASQGVAISTLSGSISGSLSSTATDVSSYFQLNNMITGTSAATFRVSASLLADPDQLADGTLNTSASPGTPPFSGVGAGDGTTANAMSNAMSNNQSFTAAGYLGSASTSFSSYAANLISDVANRASTASTNSTSAQATFNTFVTNYSSATGVNVDEQTANLVTLQNTYAASAKVISTVSAMFNALISAINA